jgi:hypothetical protein
VTSSVTLADASTIFVEMSVTSTPWECPNEAAVPHANVSDLDGCPRFAEAYLGRK